MEFADLIKAPKAENVVLHRPFEPDIEGTLCITGHHLILSSRKDSAELWLLHRMVDCVEKKMGAFSGTVFIKCKDFRVLQLDIPNLEDCNNVAASIENLMNLDNPLMYFPFFHRASFEFLEDGWMSFAAEVEYSKMVLSADEWRISHVNKDYKVCSTYPQAVIVPKSICDETLKVVAAFRQFGRFPVLSYFHKETKAALMRSSQPMVGANLKRCKEDERLLNVVLGSGKKGYIIDTRSQNAMYLAKSKVPFAAAGGSEPEVHYPLWKRLHKPIDRYFTFLESLTKLIEACSDVTCSTEKWLSRMESSGWLHHVKDILTCACLIAQCLDIDEIIVEWLVIIQTVEGFVVPILLEFREKLLEEYSKCACVLVHGAEGTDATLQVCSLAQVILNPDCRTVHGFEALIEREWLQAGHPFHTRCQSSAYASSNFKSRDQSPTFLMFLDCVFQIHNQYPCSFEFNEKFLITLFEHAYASQFGTFLGNCDKDRHEMQLAKKTVSLWSMLNRTDMLLTFLNPMYEPNSSVVWPSVASQSLSLWSGMYLRWVVDQQPIQEAWSMVSEIREKEKELQLRAVKLRRILMDLQREAVDTGLLSPCSSEDLPMFNS